MNIFKTLTQDITHPEALHALKLVWKSYSFWLLMGAFAGWVYCACAPAMTNTLSGAVILWLFSTLMAAIAVADAKTYIVPDALLYPLAILGLVAMPQNLFFMGLGALLLGAMFLLVKVGAEKILRQDALGWGDIKLVTVLGLWLGVTGIVPFLLLSSLGAVVVVLVMRLLKRGNVYVPYAPFLAFGGWMAYPYGDIINAWLIALRITLIGDF